MITKSEEIYIYNLAHRSRNRSVALLFSEAFVEIRATKTDTLRLPRTGYRQDPTRNAGIIDRDSLAGRAARI